MLNGRAGLFGLMHESIGRGKGRLGSEKWENQLPDSQKKGAGERKGSEAVIKNGNTVTLGKRKECHSSTAGTARPSTKTGFERKGTK